MCRKLAPTTPAAALAIPARAVVSSSSTDTRLASLLSLMKAQSLMGWPRTIRRYSLNPTRSEAPSKTAETTSTPRLTHGETTGAGCRMCWTPS